MKLKNRKQFEIKIFNKIGIVILFVFITSTYIFLLLNKKATPVLMNYAELETSKLATLIINKAVSNHVEQGLTVESLLITTKNKDDEIISVDFDTLKVSKALNSITNAIQTNLKLIETGKFELINKNNTYKFMHINGGLIYYIPFGIITNIPVLANIGPRIPIKTNLIGSVKSNIKTKIIDYGINNALLKVYIEVMVSEQVILPFVSKRINTKVEIPVLVKLIQGKIPKVYGGAYSVTSPLIESTADY